MTVNGASTVNALISSVSSAVNTIGRAGLNALGPDNFEYYMCAFKLLDSNGEKVAYMSLPVMPNSIMESKIAIATVTKTSGALVTQFNSTFAPIDISLQGTFGRKIRLLLGSKEYEKPNDGASSSFDKAQKFFNGNWGIGKVNVLVKTGYGLVQMLRHIIDGTYDLDEYGKPHVLIFDNYTLNEHYVVEPLQRSFNQSTENNMIWYYNVEMKAIANASDMTNGETSVGQMIGNVALGALSNTVSNLINNSLRMIAL
jgi:hypothetical protein